MRDKHPGLARLGFKEPNNIQTLWGKGILE
jgi:hypothetical protein